MRIRNRSLPFSSFSSPPSSDLCAIPETRSQSEQEERKHQHEEEEEEDEEKVHLNPGYFSGYSPPPSDESRSPSKEDDQLLNSKVYEHGNIEGSSLLFPHQEDFATVEEEEGEETWGVNPKRSKNRGAETPELLLSSQGARWSEGESAFPLKKRKRKYEFMIVSPTLKKKQEDSGVDNRVTNVKKVKNNVSVLEGSRCSRVNGRGWRCCQATLVGYSLCEHHLGKGRLKSINNGPRQPSGSKKRMGSSKKKKEKQFSLGKSFQEEDDDDDDDNEVVEGKRRKKKKKKKVGGIVKARSMSSLLGQMKEA